MTDLFASKARVVATTLVGDVAVSVFVAWVLLEFDVDGRRSVGVAITAGLFSGLVMAGSELWRAHEARADARRTIGPRFETDRDALRRAMATGELPDDLTLDGPLIAAIGVERRQLADAGGRELPTWVAVPLLAALLGFVALRIGLPWGALVFLVLPINRWRFRGRAPRAERLAALREAAEVRRGVLPAPGVLTYADLEG